MAIDLTAVLKSIPTPIAVACSGGLDSIALLHAVCMVNKQQDFKPIALHIDHGIHPESAAWATQVKATAMQFGANFASERVAGLTGDMPSLENAARNARHAALTWLCNTHGIATLLLAHHANDQAETILLNLMRGSGLGGVGMPATRQVDTTTWLRPWLNVSRKEIEAYAAQHSLTWTEDPSNTDETLRRNAIRHSLWPVIQTVEPRALPSLLRFAELAQNAAQTEVALAATCLKPYLLSNDGLILDWFKASHGHTANVQAALLRAWLAHLGCKPPSQARLHAMLAQLNAKTGDGLRCKHANWEFAYHERHLWANLRES